LELSAPIAFAVCGAPRIRTVVLDGVAASNVTLPWVQLTSLTLRMAKPSLCFPILQKTAKLVNCILHLWLQDEVVDHLPAHNIALPCLESLILSNRYDDGVNMISHSLLPAASLSVGLTLLCGSDLQYLPWLISVVPNSAHLRLSGSVPEGGLSLNHNVGNVGPV
jgi:hypothetical protein